MQSSYTYPAIFNYANDGISISFPDLPGCFSQANPYKDVKIIITIDGQVNFNIFL